MKTTHLTLLLFLLVGTIAHAQGIYRKPAGNPRTAWVSFENPTGAPGAAAQANRGAKGHAFDRLKAGETVTLLQIQGPGIINRMWITINNRRPEALATALFQIYWDGENTPAVSMPLSEFFCNPLATLAPFENCCFSNPEGRSFNSIVPMPFRKSARITLTNTADTDMTHIFYDFNLTLTDEWQPGTLYLHAIASPTHTSALGEDFTILPKISGSGRFLGLSVGVTADKAYEKLWWGEGEIKLYIDGDTSHPSLSGTGVEDYIGTAWGQGAYVNQYQGCPIADADNEQWSFYRFHLPDPVYFDRDIRVTLQQIGGGPYEKVRQVWEKGTPLTPVTVDMPGKKQFHRLLEMNNPPCLDDDEFPRGWVNFYRQDSISSVAYLYLDRPAVHLKTNKK